MALADGKEEKYDQDGTQQRHETTFFLPGKKKKENSRKRRINDRFVSAATRRAPNSFPPGPQMRNSRCFLASTTTPTFHSIPSLDKAQNIIVDFEL